MSNKDIAIEIKQELLSDKELEMSIRSCAKGSFEVFIRNGHFQKIKYKMLEIDSRTYDNLDEYVDDEIELPAHVYRRFCLLLSEMIKELCYPMEYGYLVFEWEFVEEQDGQEWKDFCKASFIKERHKAHTTSH